MLGLADFVKVAKIKHWWLNNGCWSIIKWNCILWILAFSSLKITEIFDDNNRAILIGLENLQS